MWLVKNRRTWKIWRTVSECSPAGTTNSLWHGMISGVAWGWGWRRKEWWMATMKLINGRVWTVASLGWVTPGAATEGFFAHRCHYHYRFLLLSLRCHPLQGVTPHLFYLSDLVFPLFFVNLPTKFIFLRVSRPCSTRGGPPPSDATEYEMRWARRLWWGWRWPMIQRQNWLTIECCVLTFFPDHSPVNRGCVIELVYTIWPTALKSRVCCYWFLLPRGWRSVHAHTAVVMHSCTDFHAVLSVLQVL